MAGTFTYAVDLQSINTTYNNVTTSASSQGIETPRGRNFLFSYRLQSSGTPTRLRISVEFKRSADSNWYELDESFFSRVEHEATEVASSGKRYCITGPAVGEMIRITVSSTGTSASNTFTMSEGALAFKD